MSVTTQMSNFVPTYPENKMVFFLYVHTSIPSATRIGKVGRRDLNCGAHSDLSVSYALVRRWSECHRSAPCDQDSSHLSRSKTEALWPGALGRPHRRAPPQPCVARVAPAGVPARAPGPEATARPRGCFYPDHLLQASLTPHDPNSMFNDNLIFYVWRTTNHLDGANFPHKD